MIEVEIDSLPETLSPVKAVEAAYEQQIAQVWSRAVQGLSVLLHCEKQLIPYLQMILKKKLSQQNHEVMILDGRSAQALEGPTPSRISMMVEQMRQLLNTTARERVYLLPYLDILTSTVRNSLSIEAREIMTLIHENPFLTFIAFEDPEFPIPALVKQAFPVQISMIGIERQSLHRLITRQEALKFGRGRLNLMQLYKYISGLNPVRLRHLLSLFHDKTDFNPEHPQMLKQYFRLLRDYTSGGGLDLSQIHLETDIAGYSAVKTKIRENILSLLSKTYQSKDEAEIASIEALIPKGLILYGPPGTGKTLFAKGIAEAIHATVHIVSGPELKSRWVGQGEANIRQLFARARSTAPAVIVFDELDSIASRRTSGADDGGSQAHHSMVNQLLTEMDGFRKEELIFVVGTTNLPESLDPAFLRPGRFEYQLQVDYPDWDDRKAIIALYNGKLDTGLTAVELEKLASWSGRLTDTRTPYTGDHLYALMRDMKRYQLRQAEDAPDFSLQAWLNNQNYQHQMDEAETYRVAIHESGHTLMYYRFERMQEVKKVTIESGIADALGLVESEERQAHMYTQQQLRQEIAILLGGYAAEKNLLGDYSTGAANDLYQATQMAQSMVAQYGMGNLEVPRSYTQASGEIQPYALNLLSVQIDALLIEIHAEVEAYLQQNQAELKALSAQLVSQRTLDATQIDTLLKQ